MKIEKDDRKVEKSYLIENWLTLNKTPFSQWKTEAQHKNLLLMCLEIFEEMETQLRKEKIPVKMDFREIAEDKEILCTCQVQAAVCALFYVLVCEIHPVQVLFSGKDQTLSFTATGGTGETASRKSISIDMPDTRRRGRIGTGRDYSAYQGEFRQDKGTDPGSLTTGAGTADTL